MEHTKRTSAPLILLVLALVIAGVFIFISQRTPVDEQVQQVPNADQQATTTPTSQTTDDAVDGTGTTGTEHPQQPAPLGPRQPAASPGAALALFVEAMGVGNYDRAFSYIWSGVRDQYYADLETGRITSLSAVVRAYQEGTVEGAQLVSQADGIYEIAVYPANFNVPYRIRFAYFANIDEFAILEF